MLHTLGKMTFLLGTKEMPEATFKKTFGDLLGIFQHILWILVTVVL